MITKRLRITAAILAVVFFFFLFLPLPKPLFPDDRSTVLLDDQGELLGAAIADDEQWRFPEEQGIPERYETCLLRFEDKRFYYHPGIDPVAVMRSLWINLRSGAILSGASTISMQVIRLAFPHRPRTIGIKILESFQALKLELLYSKKDIMLFYAGHAPFGGNAVGLSAASWRYWGRPAKDLSWAEAALLAVLPNSPSLMHPGRNRDALLEKRNALLLLLLQEGDIDEMTYSLSLEEPLPDKPYPLPSEAPHLLQRAIAEGYKGRIVSTTIDGNMQKQVNRVVAKHSRFLAQKGIYNAAVMVADLETGNILSYVGNSPDDGSGRHGHAVDIIPSHRSSGSLLKPLLYALAMDNGLILPDMLLKDTPVNYGLFSPENFHRSYDGAVAGSNALIRSLNVPFVNLLQSYSYNRFHSDLQEWGLELPFSADHYGLSLILGGAEVSLWDVMSLFSSLGRQMDPEMRSHGAVPSFSYTKDESVVFTPLIHPGQGAVWFTLNAMKDLIRPETESSWELYQASRPVAWKTGTSMGGRDAWAVGLTNRYCIGVWVGNADGEGRPGINGLRAAAPILFDTVRLLPSLQASDSPWFSIPLDQMKLTSICTVSGYKAGPYCPSEERLIPVEGLETGICPYHKRIHLDESGRFRVDSRNYPVSRMQHRNWFVLPPVQEYYYKRVHHEYRSLPPLLDNEGEGENPLRFIYPSQAVSEIKLPRLMNGEKGRVVFDLAARDEAQRIFWHLDNRYLGITRFNHQMGIQAPPGEHTLTVISETGDLLSKKFRILE